MYVCVVLFFEQKTAYELRISDWSSDVCSSDLVVDLVELAAIEPHAAAARAVVDLHAVARGHHQRLVVDRTFHAASSSVPCSGCVEYGSAALRRNPSGRF